MFPKLSHFNLNWVINISFVDFFLLKIIFLLKNWLFFYFSYKTLKFIFYTSYKRIFLLMQRIFPKNFRLIYQKINEKILNFWKFRENWQWKNFLHTFVLETFYTISQNFLYTLLFCEKYLIDYNYSFFIMS